MAQYGNDFSQYTAGAQPSDWTKRFNTNFTWTVEADAGATGGKILRMSGGSENQRSGLTWDLLDNDAGRDNLNKFFRARVPSASTNGQIFAMTRGSGAAGTETFNRFGATFDNQRVAITSRDDGTFHTIAFESKTFSADTWYNIEIEDTGSRLKIRLWASTDAKPAAWDIDTPTPSSAATGLGWVGLFGYTPDVIEFDFYGVGTGGDAAPTELVTSTPPPGIPETTANQPDGSPLASTEVTRIVTRSGTEIFNGTVTTDEQGVLPALDLSETAAEVDDDLVDRIEFTGTVPHMNAIEFTVKAEDIGGE